VVCAKCRLPGARAVRAAAGAGIASDEAIISSDEEETVTTQGRSVRLVLLDENYGVVLDGDTPYGYVNRDAASGAWTARLVQRFDGDDPRPSADAACADLQNHFARHVVAGLRETTPGLLNDLIRRADNQT